MIISTTARILADAGLLWNVGIWFGNFILRAWSSSGWERRLKAPTGQRSNSHTPAWKPHEHVCLCYMLEFYADFIWTKNSRTYLIFYLNKKFHRWGAWKPLWGHWHHYSLQAVALFPERILWDYLLSPGLPVWRARLCDGPFIMVVGQERASQPPSASLSVSGSRRVCGLKPDTHSWETPEIAWFTNNFSG